VLAPFAFLNPESFFHFPSNRNTYRFLLDGTKKEPEKISGSIRAKCLEDGIENAPYRIGTRRICFFY